MRSTIETAPKDGQFVIIEDASGNEDVASWSSEQRRWIGLRGEASAIQPTHWWPLPAEGAPAPTEPPPPPPGFVLPRLTARTRSRVLDEEATVLFLPEQASPRGRHSLPVLSVALLGCVALLGVVASAALVVGGLRGDRTSDIRDGLDAKSAAAPLLAARRATDVADVSAGQRPRNADASLKSAIERAASDLRATGGKLEQFAILEAARLNQALERGAEIAFAHPADDPTTGGVAEIRASARDEASQARLAGSIGGARALVALSAVRDPDAASETERLIERASGLLGQGDIGAARLILALAQDLGNARAAFMLAETYDPLVLSSWTALGTRADPAKAHELYAKAYADGIGEAKARLEALPR